MNKLPAHHHYNTYRIFGIALASDFSLDAWLTAVTDPPELSIAKLSSRALIPDFERSTPLYTNPKGNNLLKLYQSADCYYFRFRRADFYIWPREIGYHTSEAISDKHKLNYLHSPILAFWLEQQGIPVLHATAVLVGGRAAAFMAHSGCGKTTLAAAFVQAGYPLLTDDSLPIEAQNGGFIGRPGYPVMRMWPGEAQAFLGDYKQLEPIYPDADKRSVLIGSGKISQFSNLSQPLARIYVLERYEPTTHAAQIRITPLSQRDAVLALVKYSALPRIVQSIGLSAQRLEIFGRMARSVPISRLAYPGGYENLALVRQAVLSDLED